MSGKAATAAFQSDLANEDPDAAAFFGTVEVEEVVHVDENFWFYWNAWKRIMDDRFRDGFGNIGRIFYTSMSQYARDKRLSYDEAEIFMHVIGEMDDDYLKFTAEKREAEKDT